MAWTPSLTTWSRLRTLPSSSASRVMRTSPSSSSTRRTSIGRTASASIRGVFLGGRRGMRDLEGRPGRRGGFEPDAAAVELDDLLGQRQADAGACILGLAVQAIEDGEDLLRVVGSDADAV